MKTLIINVLIEFARKQTTNKKKQQQKQKTNISFLPIDLLHISLTLTLPEKKTPLIKISYYGLLFVNWETGE